MSAAKENPCRKFQANIFNKSKCQNCFKPRESHLLNDEDLTQAKPIYGGWLLLAPDGTDFDNPVHRSRKWQRRFFILYEHGLLRYALDEMPTTLPQGTINMNQCTDVVDGEGRTGQKFSLCILTPEKEHFIRAETKEIISGWLEMLMVYPRTNKQNQKKKRKVEPPTPQEPGPAKMAVTSSSSIPSAEKVPTTKSTLWQEEMRAKDQPDGSNLSPAQSPSQSQPSATSTLREPGLESKDGSRTPSRMVCSSSLGSLDVASRPPAHMDSGSAGGRGAERPGRTFAFKASRQYAALADVPKAVRISHREAFQVERRRLERRTRARSPGREEVARLFGNERRSCPSPPSPAVWLCDVTRPSFACFAPISAPSPAVDGLMMRRPFHTKSTCFVFVLIWFLILFTVGTNDVNSWAFFLLNFGCPGVGAAS